MLTGIEGKGWQRRWDQGRGSRHVMSRAPGMFFLILFYFILLILIDYEDTTSNCHRQLPQPPTYPTLHNKGPTMVYCCWAFLSTLLPLWTPISTIWYQKYLVEVACYRWWLCFVRWWIIRQLLGKLSLRRVRRKRDYKWRRNIDGDKRGMFLFLFLFFNFTN